MFQHIQTSKLRIIFRAAGEGRLPSYLGSTLRGILGHSFRAYSCHTSSSSTPNNRNKYTCHMCKEKTQCPFAQYFRSPGNDGGAVNPYVLYSLIRNKTHWISGDICIFDITLIGKVTQNVHYYLKAIEGMERIGWGAQRIPFKLEKIMDLEHDRSIFDQGGWKANTPEIQGLNTNLSIRHVSEALVIFDTPLRILEEQRLLSTLPFSVFVKSISRRLSLLSQAYTDHLIRWDEEYLKELSSCVYVSDESWEFIDFKRYSITHKEDLSLPAIEGWVLYQGDLKPFIPLLEAGRILHVGKDTTIGFGHFDVVYS